MSLSEWRHETKYRIDSHGIRDIENIIKDCNCFIVKLFPERKINNIYFDTINYKAYLDNIIGISSRKKYRIRWYGDDMLHGVNPNLEIKIKNSSVNRKILNKVNNFELRELLAEKSRIDEIISISKKKKILSGMLPVLINTYKRKYYTTVNRKFRITLDYHLKYYKVEDVINKYKYHYNNDSIIVEIKYNVGNEIYLNGITDKFHNLLSCYIVFCVMQHKEN